MINNLKIGNAQLIETGRLYGNMNTNKAFFPEDYSIEDRRNAFMNSRMLLGKDYGFDGHKFFMADQKDQRGTWFEIDNEYVEANPNGWSDIRQDILVITDKTPGVVIGHPVADCPVVMAYDKKQNVLAIGHCSAELVDRKMPMLVVDALYNSYRSKDEDIAAYVSACAGNSWTYDKYPSWAKYDNIWDSVIVEDENGLFHIDLKKAVLDQLKERNIDDIVISPIDTITDIRFYSNSAAFNGKSYKKGRHFAGAFFKEEACNIRK